jgi:hypothetical protein
MASELANCKDRQERNSEKNTALLKMHQERRFQESCLGFPPHFFVGFSANAKPSGHN